ncbi:MAG: DUF1501 domain-containing protein [Planctomycetaceae bacterium]|nr:DUF1501 domain-containing protein [Planctomycetaceae bacterium]
MNRNAHTRRSMLTRTGGGFGALALAHLFARDGLLADAPRPELNGGLHHPAKVRRVIQLFMNGGASQMDTFDYKPELERRHGEQVDFGIKAAATSTPGAVMKSPFEWQQHGQSGRWVTSVFPRIAEQVDSLAFLMAMTSQTNVHGPASYLQNTGFLAPGFPCMGAWLSYGLGRMTDELPTFVVIPDPRGLPYNNAGNFSAGFLPAAHNATIIRPAAPAPVAYLDPPTVAGITPESESAGLSLLAELNREHLAGHPGDSRLSARMEAFELAARLQTSAPAALDLSRETAETQALYGLDDPHSGPFAKNCLIARRLIERDVRFVQLWSGTSGASKNWDNHTDIINELPFIAGMVDRPIAGLLVDLQERGLLEDTLVIWTSEFGRMPFTQGATGRDHNGGTFVTWLAGAGVRAGASYGASDEFSYKAAEKPTPVWDLHATVLHLLGIDHTRLTFRHNGIDRRLTDVHGHVIHDVLA